MAPQPLQVGDDGRSLVTASGKPFFWLGDTAWELFHRCTLEEAEFYLENRRGKGFTVIQAVALAEFDGLHTPNRYGERPLIDDGPAHPNEAYFRHIDAVIDCAAAKGLHVGLLPTWGDKVAGMWGVGPIVFDAENAYAYGRWLSARYRERTNVIWILGGDRPAIHGDRDTRPVWRAMAAGIDDGVCETPDRGRLAHCEAPDRGRLAHCETPDRGRLAHCKPLKTFHPNGGVSSSAWVHAEPWLDLNMMQSGHGRGHDAPVWEMIEHDRSLTPAKPTLDGEPNYEDHPIRPWPRWDPAEGYYRDHDVRKQLYRSVFAGACGVTYGHHSIWQFYDPALRPLVNNADRSWLAALDRPGAWQAGHLRRLIESRPAAERVPDQAMLVGTPRGHYEHMRALRDGSGHWAMIYTPIVQEIGVRLDALSGSELRVWWFNPRTGVATSAGTAPARGERIFTPPIDGPDWVLALDDGARAYGAPGEGCENDAPRSDHRS